MKQIITMLARSADGAMLVDQDGKVAYWNRTAERMLGFRAGEVLGRPCHDVLRAETLSGHALCSPTCAISKSLASGEGVRNFDLQTHTKAGRTIWLNVSSLPVPSRRKGRYFAVHLFRDISKQAKVRQLAQELQTIVSHTEASPPTVPDLPPSPPPGPSETFPLSVREREILLLLAGGADTKMIADRLCISLATVRNHIQHILEKLGAHTRLQALAIAFHPGRSSQ
jgi:PAS domain S-box-containing protein